MNGKYNLDKLRKDAKSRREIMTAALMTAQAMEGRQITQEEAEKVYDSVCETTRLLENLGTGYITVAVVNDIVELLAIPFHDGIVCEICFRPVENTYGGKVTVCEACQERALDRVERVNPTIQ